MSADDATLASVYADALLDLTFQKGVAQEVLAELQEFGAVLAKDELFEAFMNTPKIGSEQKKEVIIRAFGDVVSEYTLNFLQVVIDKRRQHYLLRMIETFEEGYHVRMGEVVVKATTAIEMKEEQRSVLTDVLKRKYDKEIILQERVNERPRPSDASE